MEIEMKHLVMAKFKEGVVVEEIIKGMEDLVSHVDYVSSFEWGEDVKSEEMVRQGFTHAFMMTFKKQEDLTAFIGHPKHVEFSATFLTAIDKVLLLDFPVVFVKPKAEVAPPANEVADELAAEIIPADDDKKLSEDLPQVDVSCLTLIN